MYVLRLEPRHYKGFIGQVSQEQSLFLLQTCTTAGALWALKGVAVMTQGLPPISHACTHVCNTPVASFGDLPQWPSPGISTKTSFWDTGYLKDTSLPDSELSTFPIRVLCFLPTPSPRVRKTAGDFCWGHLRQEDDLHICADTHDLKKWAIPWEQIEAGEN